MKLAYFGLLHILTVAQAHNLKQESLVMGKKS